MSTSTRSSRPDSAPKCCRELRQQVTATPGWGRRRLLTGQVIDVRFRVLGRLIEQTVDHLRRRETTKAAFLELGGEVRRVHLELGRDSPAVACSTLRPMLP